MKTITETKAAQMLHVTRTTVRRACMRGTLVCVRGGGMDGNRICGISVESVRKQMRKQNPTR